MGLQECPQGSLSPRHPPPPWITVSLCGFAGPEPPDRGQLFLECPLLDAPPLREPGPLRSQPKAAGCGVPKLLLSPLGWVASPALEALPPEGSPVSAVWPTAVSGPGRPAVQDHPPALLRMQLAKRSGTHTQAFPLPLPDLGGLLEGKGHGLNAPSVDGVGKGPCFRGFPGPSARPGHRRSSLFPDGSLPGRPGLVTRWAWQKAVSFPDGPVVKNLRAMQEPQGPGSSP